jgi:cyclic-di-GMP phosphodiesterase, flagellum assembly factor TipF
VIDLAIYTVGAAVSAAFGWALFSYGIADINLANAAAALLFLFLIALRNAIARARLARHVEEDMDDLRADNQAIRSALDEAKQSMTAVTSEFTKKSEAQQKRLMADLQAIERLVRANAASAANVAKVVKATQAVEPSLRAYVPQPGLGHNLADPTLLEIIRRALEENRVDLYLQPVVSLPQRKVRFYEALTRLRSEDGAVIMPAQFMKVAAPAGLMSIIDNLLLFRCVQIVRRLTNKHRDIAVFCNISEHTLHDSAFFPQFLEFMTHHRDLANNIVFEFAQSSVMSAGSAEAANLRHLANLGFRLSLDQMTQLNLDFARVKKLGFQFLKLKASTLLYGMSEAQADVAAEDFQALLFRNGIDLIVERVESEKTVVQLLEYNVEMGQGYLFGEPKPTREVGEAYDPRASAPAPNVTLLSKDLKRRLAG